MKYRIYQGSSLCYACGKNSDDYNMLCDSCEIDLKWLKRYGKGRKELMAIHGNRPTVDTQTTVIDQGGFMS